MSPAKLSVFGLHAVQALLEKQPDRIIQLYVQKDRKDQKMQQALDLAQRHRIKIELLTRTELDRLTQNAVHQGLAASCHKAKTLSENDLDQLITKSEKPLFLILDGIQDPHNLGACLRCADAAGVDALIVPRDKSVSITSTVSKVACGAAETVPFVQVTNLARTLRDMKDQGVWLFGAAGEAENTLYQADFKQPAAIILGAEGQGLRRLTREHCDMLLTIPMRGSVSSLNVSVATGIFLFEALRQRNNI